MRIIYFIESYVAGGSDMIAKTVLNNLKANDIFLFVNKRADFSILKSNLNSEIKVIEYSLFTPKEIYAIFNQFKKIKVLNLFLKMLSHLLIHFLIIYSIAYFYIHFKKINATNFFSHNGGHPGGLFNGTSVISASFISSIKQKFYVYHSNPIKYKISSILLDFFLDKMIEKSSKLVTISKTSSEEILKKRFIKNKPIVIHNGIPKKKIKKYSETNKLKILNIGYFDFNKNQILLLKSLMILKNKFKNIHLTFIGKTVDNEVRYRFNNFLIVNNLKSFVTVIDFQMKIDKYYYESDLLICTSFIEGLSLSILEAMSIGLPIISTDTGGVNEQVINNQNGFIIKNNDPIKLSNKIEFFFENKKKLEIMGRESYKIFNDKFALNKMIKSYNNLLND